MRLFLDSANTKNWTVPADAGFIYGVTTNPLIFKREGVRYSNPNLMRLIATARDYGLHELQIQITNLGDPKSAVRDFMTLFDLWPTGVVAKVPFCAEGFKVLKHLPVDVPLTMTTGYTPGQAMLAANRQARYFAPYYGRLASDGQDADAIVDTMLKICAPTQTRVLIASLRSVEQIVGLAARGHDTFTVSPSILREMMLDPASVNAAAEFEDAWAKNKN